MQMTDEEKKEYINLMYPATRIKGLKKQRSAWKNLPTKLVRIPVDILEEVMAYAKELDNSYASKQ